MSNFSKTENNIDGEIYIALGPNVFVREIKVETQIGGFIMTDAVDSDFTYGEVISCSEGYFDKGTYVPANVKPGDKIAFAKISGTRVYFNDEQMTRVFMGDIVAKAVKGRIISDEEEGV